MAGYRQAAGHLLRFHINAGPRDANGRGHVCRLEPHIPPFIAGCDQHVAQHVLRCLRPPLARQIDGAGHGDEVLREQAMRFQPRPMSLAGAQGGVNAFGGEVDQLIADIEAHRQFRVLHLKCAQAAGQPVGGDGLHGGNGEHVLQRITRGTEAFCQI
jgi:hypothetical protein